VCNVRGLRVQQRDEYGDFREDRQARLPAGLGVTAIWLLPSFLAAADDGYDIADCIAFPRLRHVDDFRDLSTRRTGAGSASHRAVLNHTSDRPVVPAAPDAALRRARLLRLDDTTDRYRDAPSSSMITSSRSVRGPVCGRLQLASLLQSPPISTTITAVRQAILDTSISGWSGRAGLRLDEFPTSSSARDLVGEPAGTHTAQDAARPHRRALRRPDVLPRRTMPEAPSPISGWRRVHMAFHSR